MKKLWECSHPYYAEQGCAYSNGCHINYESWEDFIEEWGDSDSDMNLVYRWDWREGEDWGVADGKAELHIYFMLQRKAAPMSATTSVTREDEPAIRAWLEQRAKTITAIWAPIVLGMANS